MLYFDILLYHLGQSAQGETRKSMNRFGWEYKSDFARHYMTEGRAEGRVNVLLKLLTLRFGPLAEAVQTVVRSATEAQLDELVERVLTVQTLEEALGSLS